jgi:hypothetical protein
MTCGAIEIEQIKAARKPMICDVSIVVEPEFEVA